MISYYVIMFRYMVTIVCLLTRQYHAETSPWLHFSYKVPNPVLYFHSYRMLLFSVIGLYTKILKTNKGSSTQKLRWGIVNGGYNKPQCLFNKLVCNLFIKLEKQYIVYYTSGCNVTVLARALMVHCIQTGEIHMEVPTIIAARWNQAGRQTDSFHA